MISHTTHTRSTLTACDCHNKPHSRSRSFASNLIMSCPEATGNESRPLPEHQSWRLLNSYRRAGAQKKKTLSTSCLSARLFGVSVQSAALIRCSSNLSSVKRAVLQSLENGAGASHGKHAELSWSYWQNAPKKNAGCETHSLHPRYNGRSWLASCSCAGQRTRNCITTIATACHTGSIQPFPIWHNVARWVPTSFPVLKHREHTFGSTYARRVFCSSHTTSPSEPRHDGYSEIHRTHRQKESRNC
jgi:hypothetical protein